MIWYPWPVQGLCRSINLRTWDYFNQIASRFYCSSSKYLHNHRTREGYKTERVHLPSSWTVIMKTMKWVRAETEVLFTGLHPIWYYICDLISAINSHTTTTGRDSWKDKARQNNKKGTEEEEEGWGLCCGIIFNHHLQKFMPDRTLWCFCCWFLLCQTKQRMRASLCHGQVCTTGGKMAEAFPLQKTKKKRRRRWQRMRKVVIFIRGITILILSMPGPPPTPPLLSRVCCV